MLIDIANLRVATENPRKTPADEAAHLSLVASMKAHGQITNILVRPGDEPGLFAIIDGGRRFQAAKAAELEHLKADLYEGTSDAGEIGAAAAGKEWHPRLPNPWTPDAARMALPGPER
jgi:ParB/RepB/Spo0J family partition protein